MFTPLREGVGNDKRGLKMDRQKTREGDGDGDGNENGLVREKRGKHRKPVNDSPRF